MKFEFEFLNSNNSNSVVITFRVAVDIFRLLGPMV